MRILHLSGAKCSAYLRATIAFCKHILSLINAKDASGSSASEHPGEATEIANIETKRLRSLPSRHRPLVTPPVVTAKCRSSLGSRQRHAGAMQRPLAAMPQNQGAMLRTPGARASCPLRDATKETRNARRLCRNASTGPRRQTAQGPKLSHP